MASSSIAFVTLPCPRCGMREAFRDSMQIINNETCQVDPDGVVFPQRGACGCVWVWPNGGDGWPDVRAEHMLPSEYIAWVDSINAEIMRCVERKALAMGL